MRSNRCDSNMLISIFDKNLKEKNNFIIFEHKIYSFNNLIEKFNKKIKYDGYDNNIKIEWSMIYLLTKNIDSYNWKKVISMYEKCEITIIHEISNFFINNEKDKKKIFLLIYKFIIELKKENDGQKINTYHDFFNNIVNYKSIQTCDFKICHLYDNKYWIYKKGFSLDIVNINYNDKENTINLELLRRHEINEYDIYIFYNPI